MGHSRPTLALPRYEAEPRTTIVSARVPTRRDQYPYVDSPMAPQDKVGTSDIEVLPKDQRNEAFWPTSPIHV